MPVKSVNELIAEANANFPDNVTGLITPALLRNFVLDFLSTMAPFYGQLTSTGPTVQALTTTPSLLVFANAYDSNPAQSTSVVPASTITRAERGSSRINISVTLACTNAVTCTVRLYKDGAPTIWKTTLVGRGAANPVSASFVAFDYADPAPVYSLRISSETNVSATLTDLVMLLATAPVNSFT